MSHIVTIRTQVRDPAAAAAACRRLELPAPYFGAARLFEGEVSGLLVSLPGWRYPVACDTATGELRYDHFNGAWGDPAHLDRFLQRYAAEVAIAEARRRGHTVREQALPDGSLRLTIAVGGGA